MHPLDYLYKPRSIAVVGASAEEAKAGYQMVHALKVFPGEVYPINPRAETILGYKAYPSLKAVGKPVDLAIFAIPALSCVKALQEAGEAGVRAALIIGGGFAEAGGEGIKAQEEIVSICHKYDIKLLGPNTAGFTNPKAKVIANFSPWIGEISAGGVGIIAQSGAMSFSLAALTKTLDLGASLITGIGNGAVVNIADVVEYLGEDEDTKVIVLYLEGVGVGQGRRLYEVIKKTTAKKPVIFYTIGQTDIGEFAVSHTGNLIGSYKLKVAALIQAGAVRADSGDDAIDAASLLLRRRLQPKENPGVGLLTGQAGPGLVMADYLKSRGVLLPELQPSTIDKIKKELPPISYIKNPVDTTRPGQTFPNVLQAMAEDPSIDILTVFSLHEPIIIDPAGLFKRFKDVKQPLIFGTGGFPEHLLPTRKLLAEQNIPLFISPDRTAKAVRAMVDDSKAAYRLQNSRTQGDGPFVLSQPIKKAPNEAEALDILDRIGIPSPKRAVCSTHEEALQAFAGLNKPCVVKVLDPLILHKTEVGGVILGVKTEEQLIDALKRIDGIKTETNKRGKSKLRANKAGDNKKYLLAETAEEGLEIIIGGVNDPAFGPAVLLGLGGTMAEAFGDVSMRLAPLTELDAREMIAELRGNKLFYGWRGSPAADINCLVGALQKIGRLMAGHPEIKEMDINPVRVYEKGLLALDALVILK